MDQKTRFFLIILCFPFLLKTQGELPEEPISFLQAKRILPKRVLVVVQLTLFTPFKDLQFTMSAADSTSTPATEKAAKFTPSRATFSAAQLTEDFVGEVMQIKNVYSSRPATKYGFVSVGDDRKTAPTVYFSFDSYKNTDEFILRKGYVVSYKVKADEKDADRFVAYDLELTEEGRTIATAREESIANDLSNRVDKESKGGDDVQKKKKKARSSSKPLDTRAFQLNLTGEGIPAGTTVEASMAQSMGKLKHTCLLSLGDTDDYTPQVYHSDGRLMSKAILATMADGDSIYLGPKVEEAEAN